MARYIDADAFEKQITNRYFYIDVLPILDRTPTADVRENVRGEWIDAVIPNDNGGLPVQVCDQCNTFFPLAYTGGGHLYCPNCGAKMEVER